MRILVANLGSTSFKYRLFDMTDEREIARGGIERIGAEASRCVARIGDWSEDVMRPVADHGVAVQVCLDQLTDPQHGCLGSPGEVNAIGFKAVHGGTRSGVFRVDETLLSAMEAMNPVAPAHNPPYVAAMRSLASQVGDIPLVAAFETDFHRTAPEAMQTYAIPRQWADELPLRKWGFHGASHRYIATRCEELFGTSKSRVISCHLGGSSSVCGIHDGKSLGASMGMSPQTGLPQNNRVGDFDPFALPLIMQHTGLSLEAVLDKLANEGGLLGISGHSADIRDIEEAAAAGNAACQLALATYVAEVRRYIGGYLVALGGCDVLVFTGGIGENGRQMRADICAGLSELGIELDAEKNATASGEVALQADSSRAAIWVLPTNEELIVARQSVALLS
ncbi:acetate/propionate family kinase [Planctomycetaceae bacterium SH139]